MSLKVVGAGLGRTGTHSLKLALEQLLGGPCYHMIEVFEHPEHIDVWRRAAEGEAVDWASFPKGYTASVDWPGGAFWREMADANPDSIILLSTRQTSEAWWKSANGTIFQVLDSPDEGLPGWRDMIDAMFANRFTADVKDKAAAIAAYERHNADVRATADPARLLDWTTGDGWEPICAALGVPVPTEPFPHVNSTDDFRAMVGLDPAT
ncbi:MAG TPA: sulfotransferase [Acidimicrobiales bacterium]|nr:sulfotransferase [Acidimicrobiales bacterium]